MTLRARPEEIARTHQALGEVSRLRLLELLRAHEDGLDAAQAAAAVGLHLATVRTHLETLVEAGLAERSPQPRSTRGRPRVIYRATDESAGAEGGGYRLLAEILASLIETSVRDPAARAEEAGNAWGHELVERARPLARLAPDEALKRVGDLLDELGFEPHVERSDGETRILLHRCPFRDVAGAHQPVVCSAHLGLIKGALGEVGAPLQDATIEPLVTPTLCVAHLREAPR